MSPSLKCVLCNSTIFSKCPQVYIVQCTVFCVISQFSPNVTKFTVYTLFSLPVQCTVYTVLCNFTIFPKCQQVHSVYFVFSPCTLYSIQYILYCVISLFSPNVNKFVHPISSIVSRIPDHYVMCIVQ